MTDEVLIRPVQDADAPALAALLNEIIATGGTTALQHPATPASLAETMLTGLNIRCCFVADDATSILLGFQTLTRVVGGPADIGDIGTFVRIGHGQRGIGSRLFAATRRAAAGNGLRAIDATIRADNVGGLAFYARNGFVHHQTQPAVPLSDGTPVDRITKRHALSPSM